MENFPLSSAYKLQLYISSFEFVLRVYDSNGVSLKQHVETQNLLRYSSSQIEKCFESIPVLNDLYKEIELVIETNTYTVIPQFLFREDLAYSFLRFGHEIHKTESVSYYYLNEPKSFLLFSVSNSLKTVLSEKFHAPKLHHHMGMILNDRSNRNSLAQILCHPRRDKVDIVVYKQGEPMLINSFDYQTDEDIVYHIVNIVDKIKLDIQKLGIDLYSLQENSALKDMLLQYVAWVKIIPFLN